MKFDAPSTATMAFLAASLRYGELNHLVTVGSIIPLRRATSSRYDERLRQQTEEQEAAGGSRGPAMGCRGIRRPAVEGGDGYAARRET
jgi:hypothetical protein